jgi:coenzyme F420-0:L-glutamate ligase/coenzyme F420-1:gamma-L-glutamate ligase
VITVWAPDGVGEVREGSDLADLLLGALASSVDPTGSTHSTDGGGGLADGDIVCVTSKVVSKAEGRVEAGDRAEAVVRETVRLVARRGPLSVVVNRLGLTMAAAGVDSSNVEPGTIVLLPVDPDASARQLRAGLAERAGVDVAVVVTDTAGRPWREGQTDIAVGAAGLRVLDDHAGRTDPYGNLLEVTAPAVADELAGAAELAAGKLGRRPFTVVRGRADLVLPAGDHGPGAVGLLREPGADLFGLGSREAVLAALGARPEQRASYGAPVAAAALADLLVALLPGSAAGSSGDEVTLTADDPRARWAAEVAAWAHGYDVSAREPRRVRFRRFTP